MEDLCWNCGSPTHHRKDCKLPSNPQLRKEIQTAFKRGLGAERNKLRSMEQLGRLHLKREESKLQTLPPLKYFGGEIDRIDQILHDIKSSSEELQTPVSADCLEAQLELISRQRSVLGEELENIRLLYQLQKAYNLMNATEDSNEFIMALKVETIHETQRMLSDSLFTTWNALKTAVFVVNEFNNLNEDMHEYIDRGIEAYSGRPLEIQHVKRLWSEKKETLRTGSELLSKYGYLFSGTDMARFQEKLSVIKESWKLLKSMKIEYEKELSKTVCKICCECEVQYCVIGCGHVFCGQCTQGILECPNCRGNM